MGTCCARDKSKNEQKYLAFPDDIRYQVLSFGSEAILFDIDKKYMRTLTINLIPQLKASGIIAFFPSLYIVGGFLQEFVSDQTFEGIIDPEKEYVDMRQSASLNIPKAKPYLVSCEQQKCIYAVGGLNSKIEPLAECEKYVIEKREWELLPKMNKAETSGIVIDDVLYAFTFISIFNTFEYFDLESYRWQSRSFYVDWEPGLTLENFSLAYYDSIIGIFGGVFVDKEGREEENMKVYKLDRETGTIILAANYQLQESAKFLHHAVSWNHFRYSISTEKKLSILDLKQHKLEEVMIDVIPQQALD